MNHTYYPRWCYLLCCLEMQYFEDTEIDVLDSDLKYFSVYVFHVPQSKILVHPDNILY